MSIGDPSKGHKGWGDFIKNLIGILDQNIVIVLQTHGAP